MKLFDWVSRAKSLNTQEGNASGDGCCADRGNLDHAKLCFGEASHWLTEAKHKP